MDTLSYANGLPSIRNGGTPVWRYEEAGQSCAMTTEPIVRQPNNVGSNAINDVFDPTISSVSCTNR